MSTDDVIRIASSHADGSLRRPRRDVIALLAFGSCGAANDDRREFPLTAWDSLPAADRAAIAEAGTKRRSHSTRP
jgi:hypothetical protein